MNTESARQFGAQLWYHEIVSNFGGNPVDKMTEKEVTALKFTLPDIDKIGLMDTFVNQDESYSVNIYLT